MNQIKYALTSLWLFLAAKRTQLAKDRLISKVKHGKENTEQIGRLYQRLYSRVAKEEYRQVNLRRLILKDTTMPILKIPNRIGKITVSEEAQKNLSKFDTVIAVERHKHADWGDIAVSDWPKNNELLIKGGGQLLSRYQSQNNRLFLLITSADHQTTTIVMEEEYQNGLRP